MGAFSWCPWIPGTLKIDLIISLFKWVPCKFDLFTFIQKKSAMVNGFPFWKFLPATLPVMAMLMIKVLTVALVVLNCLKKSVFELYLINPPVLKIGPILQVNKISLVF